MSMPFRKPTQQLSVVEQIFEDVPFNQIYGTDWKAAAVTIDPETAGYLLDNHHYQNNRKLRPQTVRKYTSIMEAGEWLLSPESLVFSKEGDLIEGQHRIRSVIASGTPQQFLVIIGVDEEIYPILNRGATRSISDATGMTKDLAAVSRLLCTMAIGNTAIPDYMLIRMAVYLQPFHSRLIETCGTSVKVYSAAPLKTAALIRLMQDDADHDYVLNTYRGQILMEYEKLSPISLSFVKHVNGQTHPTGSSTAQQDLLVRAYTAFDHTRAKNNRMVISQSYRDDCMAYFKEVAKGIVGEE